MLVAVVCASLGTKGEELEPGGRVNPLASTTRMMSRPLLVGAAGVFTSPFPFPLVLLLGLWEFELEEGDEEAEDGT